MSGDHNQIHLKGGHTAKDPRLGRIYQPDERNAEYPLRALLGAAADQPLRSHSWQVPTHFDQGDQGACVQYGISHDLIATPNRVPIPTVQKIIDDDSLYYGAQERDPWPGGAYPNATPHYDGTSVLAGMQQATAMGLYTSYHWCTSEREVAQAVGYHGPVVIGVNWYEDMHDPTPLGFVSPTGELLGGHCVAITGLNARTATYRICNSWGTGWGVKGDCYMTRADMAKLLAEDGAEMCAPQKVARPGLRRPRIRPTKAELHDRIAVDDA